MIILSNPIQRTIKMAETLNIGELAVEISNDVFSWFKWEKIDLYDENFDCRKVEAHIKKDKNVTDSNSETVVEPDETESSEAKKHTHPVDVVFKYTDPYSGKDILFNTDLKSYKSTSIKPSDVREMLQSIAKTIDCASISTEWKTRYGFNSTNYEIRGMLFIYNHDGQYHRDFYETFKTSVNNDRKKLGINIKSIGLKKGQQIHIVEPLLISFMTTVIADMHRLHHDGTFPRVEYSFYYPELLRNKTVSGDRHSRPATIEAISAPYLIIEHDEVVTKSPSGETLRTEPGFVIYYNRPGNDPYEFVYLFDTLSRYQLLDGERSIRLRFAYHSPSPDIGSNFESAKEKYIKSWGYDEHKRKILNKIIIKELSLMEHTFKTRMVARKNEQ